MFALSSILRIKQLAIRLSCKQPQPSRWLSSLRERLQPPFSPELNTMNLRALPPSPACGGGLGRGRWHGNEFVAAHAPSPPAPLMEQLAIRLSCPKTAAKSLVIPRAGEGE